MTGSLLLEYNGSTQKTKERLNRMAEWLNTVFGGMDASVFAFMHGLAESAGSLFTFLASFFTLLYEKGIVAILLGLVLILFKKTRPIGICMIGAVGLGAIITNLTLKELVERTRPYLANETFRGYWEYLKVAGDAEFSFPSGHATASMAAATALFLTGKKKWSWVGFPVAILVAASRVYLIMHYTSDVLAGMLVGLFSGAVAYGITVLLYRIAEKYRDKGFFRFALNFDLPELFKKKPAEAAETAKEQEETPKDSEEPAGEEPKQDS